MSAKEKVSMETENTELECISLAVKTSKKITIANKCGECKKAVILWLSRTGDTYTREYRVKAHSSAQIAVEKNTINSQLIAEKNC